MSTSEAVAGHSAEAQVYCGRCGSRRPSPYEACAECEPHETVPVRAEPNWPNRIVAGWTKDAQDLMDGQGILVTARWILVGAGLSAGAVEPGRAGRAEGRDRPDPDARGRELLPSCPDAQGAAPQEMGGLPCQRC